MTVSDEMRFHDWHRRAMDTWHAQSFPIIQSMVDLRLMFSVPQITVQKDGPVLHDDIWQDESAQKAFEGLEKLLESIRAEIFKRPQGM